MVGLVIEVLEEVYVGVCREHQEDFRLFKQLIHLGYYRPTTEANAASFARRHKACQFNDNRIHNPTVKLHSLSTCGHFIHRLLIWLSIRIQRQNSNKLNKTFIYLQIAI